MSQKDKILLSIIIPSKNEELNIARCLESVIKAIEDIDGVEMMVVDCFSTDNTIKEAMQFPVGIIQLKSSWVHTSSAARYLGCLNTTGKYIFIIDADMELCSNFLTKAIDAMEKNNFIAGVAGLGKEICIDKGKIKETKENLYNRNAAEIMDTDYLGGAGLFRRQALEGVGYFNPYLYSQEEFHLCQRLKKKGWRFLSLPCPMTTHYTTSLSKSMTAFKKQISSNRFTGIGQVMRWSLSHGFFWSNLWRFKKIIFSLLLGLVLQGIFIISIYLYLFITKRNFKEAFLSLIKWVYIVFTFAKGFFKKPENPVNYPLAVKVIRKL